MKRLIIIITSILILILTINFFYYRNLYRKQVNYFVELLDRQVRIVGLEVDSINNAFESDLELTNQNNINVYFFDRSKPEVKTKTIEQLKLFYSKYRDLVVKIRLYDNNYNEYTLAKDETKNEWIEGEFISLTQRPIIPIGGKLVQNDNEFNYYLVIINKNNQACGNISVTVDYKKYFGKLFSKYNLKEYQWQWVISEDGEIIFDNNGDIPEYSKTEKIVSDLREGIVSNVVHTAKIGGNTIEIFSSYYSTQLLTKDFGIVFSAPADFFQKYIIWNSVLIVIVTVLLILLIIFLFWRNIRKQERKIKELADSEYTLKRLIEEMPVGVIIYNRKREIIKANKIAAGYYSYSSETEMIGKIFPETSISEDSNYFSNFLGSSYDPNRFIMIKQPIGEIILYRNSIPIIYKREEAILEILIDITMLDSARKQEAKANIAKTEFLARMSYEIRTPLNGIIGMADILDKFDLSPEVKDIVYLLRRSTEILLGIINDILDFSKIESGKMILEETPFNIREEIYYAIDLSKTNASEKNISIRCNINDNVPDTVIGDPYRLRQVLVNIINHSIANTEKGEINIKCFKQSVKGGIITLGFEILDTGRAFDKAELKKIFGDFVYIDSMVARNNYESAFATLIARQLVELMGGTLSAVSPSGIAGTDGTKISFTVQVFSNERMEKNIDSSGITRIDELKALIITGSHGRDEELMALFHKTGLKISVTSFTKSTINQVKNNAGKPDEKYDLIIITDDEQFDGLEVAQLLWDNDLSGKYRIIMVSSNDRKGNYQKCVTLGVDHYLVKPFDQNELQDTLQKIFNIEPDNQGHIGEPRVKDLTILVVEDNKMNQQILSKMLASLGYKCDVAEEGYEGYKKARDKRYDIIFMDLIMPEMDGYESAKRIMEISPGTLIVAFTADNMPETKKKAELYGIKEFISKPVKIDDLKRLITKYSG